jgi:hypothetical protein
LLVYFFKGRILIRRPQTPPPEISISANHDQFVINDTAVFSAIIDSSINKKNISVEWQFPDTLIQNSLSVTKIIRDTSPLTVKAILKNLNGTNIDSAMYSIQPLCELPPSVAIEETDLAYNYNGLRAGNTNKKRFKPLFTNAAENKEEYTYQWYVDDSLYSKDTVLNFSKPYNNIRLVVDTKNYHCSADSLVAQIESIPALQATVIGEGKLKISSSNNWKNI